MEGAEAVTGLKLPEVARKERICRSPNRRVSQVRILCSLCSRMRRRRVLTFLYRGVVTVDRPRTTFFLFFCRPTVDWRDMARWWGIGSWEWVSDDSSINNVTPPAWTRTRPSFINVFAQPRGGCMKTGETVAPCWKPLCGNSGHDPNDWRRATSARSSAQIPS